MEKEAEKYVNSVYVDYGDLNQQAEEQIKKAFIEGMKKQLILSGVINWVACKDSLPLVVGFYTVYKPTKPYVLGLYFDSDKNFRYDKQVHENITHWQELPKPPCL
jgi:hypothetical protein